MILVPWLNHKGHIGDTINGNQVIDRGKTRSRWRAQTLSRTAHCFESFSTSASLSPLDPLSGFLDKQ